MSVKVCSPFVTPSQTSPKLGLNNNKKRPFSLLRTPTKTSAETKFIFPAVSPRPVSSHRAAEQNLVMIGTASAGSTSLGSAVSRVAAAVADTNNSNNQLTAQQRWDSLTTLSQKYSLVYIYGRALGSGTWDFCVRDQDSQSAWTLDQTNKQTNNQAGLNSFSAKVVKPWLESACFLDSWNQNFNKLKQLCLLSFTKINFWSLDCLQKKS